MCSASDGGGRGGDSGHSSDMELSLIVEREKRDGRGGD